ncbi:MAG: CPBP family intramembrane metalloprotease [Oscillochloris sp.]|nr:CPBP family intramembrane metalloprotease [Oscillochloris sp.]
MHKRPDHEGTTSLHCRVIQRLQQSPSLRGALYLGAAVGIFETIGRLQDRDQAHALVRFHLSLLPATLLVTRAFAELRPADRAAWVQLDLRSGARAFLGGAGLGSGALLSMLAVAATRGWVSAPEWGWAQVTPQTVAGAVALNLVGHLAVAWNEETVYRGYLYDTWSMALTPAGSAALLTALFALAHPLRPQTLVGEAALGSALLLLRIASKGLWAPVGYHWAWNVLQTAILGPADGPPSLRPLHVAGPHRWVGSPGQPDPGLLMTIINAAVALGLAGWLWRRRSTASADVS